MNKLIVIVGPTGVGKTKLSIELAKKYNGEIINADSTQVYKHLNIATAKIKEEEKENIPHHLLDIKELDEMYTVYDYEQDARKCIDDILKRGKTAILVGGTGLYLNAVLYDYDFEKEDTKPIDYHDTNEELYEKVCALDPNTNIHKNNRKRLIRYLSYYEKTGKKLNEKEKATTPVYDFLLIGLTTTREILYNRINDRVDEMLKEGMIEEAKELYDKKIFSKAVMTPIGYKELFPYFKGEITKEEATYEIKKRSRHYAKRQYTWFLHQMHVTWFQTDFANFSYTVEEVKNYIDSNLS
jgi:tRNA dimethylallyltransferase